jgi:hypothetical protein
VTRRFASLTPTQQFLAVLAVTVVVGALAVSVSALGNVGMLLASAALLAALAVVAQWLWQSRQSTDWDNTFAEPASARGVDSRISRLAGDVREATSGAPVPSARLHATLSSLAAERLRSHQGSEGTTDAAAVLGPDLAAYLAAPPTTRLTAAQLAAFTTTLEELS